MDAEDLFLNDGAERQVVEDVSAVTPDVDGTVLAEALVVETVDLSDLARFVVATDETDARRILHLQQEKEEEGFNGVITAIDEVAHEDVVGVRNVATDTEEFEKVEELTVDITDNSARSGHLVNVALTCKDFTCLETKFLDFSFLDGLALEKCLKMFFVKISHSFDFF